MPFAYGVATLKNRGHLSQSSLFRRHDCWSTAFHGDAVAERHHRHRGKHSKRHGHSSLGEEVQTVPVLLVSYIRNLSGVIVSIPRDTKSIEEEVFKICRTDSNSFTGVLICRGERYSNGYAKTMGVGDEYEGATGNDSVMSTYAGENMGVHEILDLGSKSNSSSVMLYNAPNLEILGIDTSVQKWNVESNSSYNSPQPHYVLFLYPKESSSSSSSSSPTANFHSQKGGEQYLVGGKNGGSFSQSQALANKTFCQHVSRLIDEGQLYVPAGTYRIRNDKIKECCLKMTKDNHNLMDFLHKIPVITSADSYEITDNVIFVFE